MTDYIIVDCASWCCLGSIKFRCACAALTNIPFQSTLATQAYSTTVFISHGSTPLLGSTAAGLATPFTLFMARTKDLRRSPAPVWTCLPPHHELEQACAANNISRVREIFAVESLDKDYATKYNRDVESLDMMRCLFEHGADISAWTNRRPPRSLDKMKLLVEFDYDVKAEGHKILQ